MLELMQNLALCHLWKELEGNKAPPDDLRKWFINEKENDPGKFFSYLVEPAGKIKKFYALSAHPDNDDIAILESADIGSLEGNSAICLPFNKPSGPQSPQIGPVIKRSYNKQKGAGPSLKILKSTLKNFQEISLSNNSWAEYFKDVNDVFNRKQIYFAGEYLDCKENALHEAINIIPENEPVFLVFKDKNNQMPGNIPEYRKYLSSMLDADNKYTTGKVGQVPRLLISVVYNKDVEFQFGNLSDYIKLIPANGKEEKAWSSPKDYTVDLSLLKKRLSTYSNKIDSVSYEISPDVKLNDEIPLEWEGLKID